MKSISINFKNIMKASIGTLCVYAMLTGSMVYAAQTNNTYTPNNVKEVSSDTDMYTANNPCLISLTDEKTKEETNINLKQVQFYSISKSKSEILFQMNGATIKMPYDNQEEASLAFKQLRLSAYYCFR